MRHREAVCLAQGHTVTAEDPRLKVEFPSSPFSLDSFSALPECLWPVSYKFKTTTKCRDWEYRSKKKKVRNEIYSSLCGSQLGAGLTGGGASAGTAGFYLADSCLPS